VPKRPKKKKKAGKRREIEQKKRHNAPKKRKRMNACAKRKKRGGKSEPRQTLKRAKNQPMWEGSREEKKRGRPAGEKRTWRTMVAACSLWQKFLMRHRDGVKCRLDGEGTPKSAPPLQGVRMGGIFGRKKRGTQPSNQKRPKSNQRAKIANPRPFEKLKQEKGGFKALSNTPGEVNENPQDGGGGEKNQTWPGGHEKSKLPRTVDFNPPKKQGAARVL